MLAIFLGGWAWVYLYKRCAKKFWIFIGSYAVVMAMVIIAFVTFFHSVQQDTCLQNQYQNNCPFPSGLGPFVALVIVSSLVTLAIHIWSIVDVATKDREWYASF